MEEIRDEWEHTITRIGRWVDFKGATDIVKAGNYAHDEIAKISGENVTISLEKLYEIKQNNLD